MSRRRLVLLGGGHAHLFVLEGAAAGKFAGTDVTLISPSREQAYSGMVPGLVAGRYQPRDLSLDLQAIATAAGVRYIGAAAAAIRPAESELKLADGTRITFDILSLATGSAVVGAGLPGVARHALPVRPINRALEVISALEQSARLEPDPAVVVVGGGAAGVEIALASRARLRRLSGSDAGTVTLLEAAPQLFGGQWPAAERHVHQALVRNRVSLRLGVEVRAATERGVELAEGSELPARVLVWAAGAASSQLLRSSGLAADASGFPLVDDRLRSISDPRVFGAGDAVTLERWPNTPKAGVYAVREGPVLRDNLAAVCAGEEPARRYTPQRRFLALLNTGDGSAVLSYPPWAVSGRWAMQLKDRIDRGFVRRFQRLAAGEAEDRLSLPTE